MPGRPESPHDQRERARRVQERLKDALDASTLGMEDLARRSGVNRRTLDKYFQGDSPNPSFFATVDIARVLKVSLRDIAKKKWASQ